MKAILTTRCGCSREMDITYPPNRVIMLPMFPDLNVKNFDEIPSGPIVKTRKFELRRFTNEGPILRAEYRELMSL